MDIVVEQGIAKADTMHKSARIQASTTFAASEIPESTDFLAAKGIFGRWVTLIGCL